MKLKYKQLNTNEKIKQLNSLSLEAKPIKAAQLPVSHAVPKSFPSGSSCSSSLRSLLTPPQTVEISGLLPADWPWTSAAAAAEAEAEATAAELVAAAEDDDNDDDDDVGKVCAFNCHLLLSAVGTAW